MPRHAHFIGLGADQISRGGLQSDSSLALLEAPPPRTFEAIKHASARLNETANRRDPVFSGHSAELYSCNVGLFTTARRSDVFAAKAAYAAVLVVFVSGNLGAKT
jgi:hypothetical protein